jgi:hypothetical protein
MKNKRGEHFSEITEYLAALKRLKVDAGPDYTPRQSAIGRRFSTAPGKNARSDTALNPPERERHISVLGFVNTAEATQGTI